MACPNSALRRELKKAVQAVAIKAVAATAVPDPPQTQQQEARATEEPPQQRQQQGQEQQQQQQPNSQPMKKARVATGDEVSGEATASACTGQRQAAPDLRKADVAEPASAKSSARKRAETSAHGDQHQAQLAAASQHPAAPVEERARGKRNKDPEEHSVIQDPRTKRPKALTTAPVQAPAQLAAQPQQSTQHPTLPPGRQQAQERQPPAPAGKQGDGAARERPGASLPSAAPRPAPLNQAPPQPQPLGLGGRSRQQQRAQQQAHAPPQQQPPQPQQQQQQQQQPQQGRLDTLGNKENDSEQRLPSPPPDRVLVDQSNLLGVHRLARDGRVMEVTEGAAYSMLFREQHTRAAPDYLSSQPRLDRTMRATLLDWMFEVGQEFVLTRETLYTAINLVDRYFARLPNVPTQRLQLVGVTALWVAAKNKEIYAPRAWEFAFSTDSAYQPRELIAMEMDLIVQLDWSMDPVTCFHWVDFYMHQLFSVSVTGGGDGNDDDAGSTTTCEYSPKEDQQRMPPPPSSGGIASAAPAAAAATAAAAVAGTAAAGTATSAAATAAATAAVSAAAATAPSASSVSQEALPAPPALAPPARQQPAQPQALPSQLRKHLAAADGPPPHWPRASSGKVPSRAREWLAPARIDLALFNRVMEVCDLAMLDINSLHFLPSAIAAAAVLFVTTEERRVCTVPRVEAVTRYKEAELDLCMRWMQFAFLLPTNPPPQHPRAKHIAMYYEMRDWHCLQRHHKGALALYNSTGPQYDIMAELNRSTQDAGGSPSIALVGAAGAPLGPVPQQGSQSSQLRQQALPPSQQQQPPQRAAPRAQLQKQHEHQRQAPGQPQHQHQHARQARGGVPPMEGAATLPVPGGVAAAQQATQAASSRRAKNASLPSPALHDDDSALVDLQSHESLGASLE